MKNRKLSSLLGLLVVGGSLVLASCGDPGTTPGSSDTSSEGTGTQYDENGLEIIEDPNAANGAYDFSNLDWKEKTKITAALESLRDEQLHRRHPPLR